MIFSILQEVLMPVSFGALLCLMLLYWGQAALFSYTRYSKLTTVLFSFSFFSLTTLIIVRWVDSGHFPLSNLYESLLFLSWSFLGIQLVAQFTLTRGIPKSALPISVKQPARSILQSALARELLRKAKERKRSPEVNNSATRCLESNRAYSAKMKLTQPTRTSPSNFVDAMLTDSCFARLGAKHQYGPGRLITNNLETPHRPVMVDFALRELSQRQLLHLIGVITSPMALLTYGFAFLKLPREMQKATALVPALQSNWLMMHVTIMILSYAALLCGSIFSMVFLLLTNLNTSAPSDSVASLQTLSKTGTIPPTRYTQTTRVGTVYPADRQYSSLDIDKALAAAAYLKAEQNTGVIPGTMWTDLPPVRFSDTLELHDWAQRAQAQVGRVAGQTLGLAEESRHRSFKSTTEFTQGDSPLKQQDPELLNNKIQFVGGGRINFFGVSEVERDLEKNTPTLDLAERLDNYSYRVLALGFPLLTVGILSGAVWANEAWGSYWSWDPKETWALITWLVFAIYLHARILKGWAGRKPAIIATFGFFVVWFCYLGVNLLGTGLHSYGWFSN